MNFLPLSRCVLPLALLAFACSIPTFAAESKAIDPKAPIPAVDPSKIRAADFADNELDIPYYLAHFHTVANAVPLEGEERGYINLSVWRGNANQRTYNARVLESQLSLAYFYCSKRPWNPYYAHPGVRARLEAMLERWCNMQSPDGKFSEYEERKWGLAPTAFATKFTGETLRLLAKGPAIDPVLHERVKQAQRKAILITLTDPDFWQHGRNYANQFSNVFAGGLAWLAMFPDDNEVRDRLMARMKQAAVEHQSPAGYFYENRGPDWGYNLSTHQSNLHGAWEFGRGTAFAPLIIEDTKRFFDWVSWNAVLEPDGSGFVLNCPIETRQRRAWVSINQNTQGRNFSSIPQAEHVPVASAFLPAAEEVKAARAEERKDLEKTWPNVPALEPGNFRGFTPYAFLHRSMVHWYPPLKDRDAARADLPYMKDGRYAHVRADDRMKARYLFVRRPNYYVAFNYGEQIAKSQRYGIGLLWAPGLGTLSQAQTGGNTDIWGTTSAGATAPVEAGDLYATVLVGGKPINPAPGGTDLGSADVEIRYAVGTNGIKQVRFEDRAIRINTSSAGTFTESVPMMLKDSDHVEFGQTNIVVQREGKPALRINFPPGTTTELKKMEDNYRVGPYRVETAVLRATNTISYSVIVGEK